MTPVRVVEGYKLRWIRGHLFWQRKAMVAIQPQPLDTSWIFLVWPGIFGISSLFSIAACFLLLLLSLLRFNDRPLLHGFLPNGMLLSTLLHFLFRTASFLVMSMGRSTLSAHHQGHPLRILWTAENSPVSDQFPLKAIRDFPLLRHN